MPKVNEKTKIIDAGDMSQATVTSTVFDGRYLQNIKLHILAGVGGTGTFQLQESLDYRLNDGAGDWVDTGVTITALTGGALNQRINLPNQGPAFYRLVYTKGSGSGTLNAYMSGSGPL